MLLVQGRGQVEELDSEFSFPFRLFCRVRERSERERKGTEFAIGVTEEMRHEIARRISTLMAEISQAPNSRHTNTEIRKVNKDR